jgi:hypothetical protein
MIPGTGKAGLAWEKGSSGYSELLQISGLDVMRQRCISKMQHWRTSISKSMEILTVPNNNNNNNNRTALS